MVSRLQLLRIPPITSMLADMSLRMAVPLGQQKVEFLTPSPCRQSLSLLQSFSVASGLRGSPVFIASAGGVHWLRPDVPDRERRDGPPEFVVMSKHPEIAMPVLPRRRNEVRQTIEELGAG